jgi:hypothetical protein
MGINGSKSTLEAAISKDADGSREIGLPMHSSAEVSRNGISDVEQQSKPCLNKYTTICVDMK